MKLQDETDEVKGKEKVCSIHRLPSAGIQNNQFP